jgi:predicted peroxiredoxin
MKEFYLRLKAKWFSTMINVHAATNEKREDVKEEFYNLEQNLNQIANSGIKILRGDFNAKVGKGNV